MSAPPADTRYEIKYVAPVTRYHELAQWIRLHPAGFRTAYPPPWVNNVYFDTPDLFTFRENLLGSSSRSKLRLRWYGREPAPSQSNLEVKRRRNQLGWKLSYRTGPVDLARQSWRGVRS